MQDRNQLKKFADFAITSFFQDYFKPFLTELIAESYKQFDIEPNNEFECVKRDIATLTKKRIIMQILKKIESANDQLNEIIKKEFNKNL